MESNAVWILKIRPLDLEISRGGGPKQPPATNRVKKTMLIAYNLQQVWPGVSRCFLTSTPVPMLPTHARASRSLHSYFNYRASILWVLNTQSLKRIQTTQRRWWMDAWINKKDKLMTDGWELQQALRTNAGLLLIKRDPLNATINYRSLMNYWTGLINSGVPNVPR